LNHIIETTIRRNNRVLLLICLGMLMIVGAAAALNYRFLVNWVLGPAQPTHSEIAAITDLAQVERPYITITGNDVYETGVTLNRTEKNTNNETVIANYLAVLIGKDRLLLVKTNATESESTFTGVLVPAPAEVIDMILSDAETAEQKENLQNAFMPVMLDSVDDFRGHGWLGIGIGVLVSLVALAGLALWFHRFTDMSTHPIADNLKRLGQLESVITQIELELASPHDQVRGLHFTSNFVVLTSRINLDAARLADVAWAFKQITQHRTYGIPTGKTYAAVIKDRTGHQIILTGPEKDINAALENLQRRAPWIVMGYSQDLESSWNNQRDSFLAAVEQRKQGIA